MTASLSASCICTISCAPAWLEYRGPRYCKLPGTCSLHVIIAGLDPRLPGWRNEIGRGLGFLPPPEWGRDGVGGPPRKDWRARYAETLTPSQPPPFRGR